ncbi:MAG: hypothetical protein MHM6MM_003432 [Cercozoa sp. M6MM]
MMRSGAQIVRKVRSARLAGVSARFSAAAASTRTPESVTSSAAQGGQGVQKHRFQAKTQQILDIVSKAIYTDKEVFLRELISNASDACEKARFLQATEDQSLRHDDLPLEIRVWTNKASNTLVVEDTGIGMNAEELVNNLGTIARSGSKEYALKHHDEAAESKDIIGQFGVGFYSSFMVAPKVEVLSQSADSSVPEAHRFVSDGTDEFEVGSLPSVHTAEEGATPASQIPTVPLQRGTRVIVHLADEHNEFSDERRVRRVLRRYSNFVGFPLFLNGKRINTVDALWRRSPSEVKQEEHEQFYRLVANAYDEPMLPSLHFRADAPLHFHALLYVPQQHTEKYGMGQMQSGVSVYSRRVLIRGANQSDDSNKDASHNDDSGILPHWLRFVKGVVDSDDLPLHVSRENMQDHGRVKMRRLRAVITRRFLRWLQRDIAEKQPELYEQFWNEFGGFLKEGAATDAEFQRDVAPLLRFESNFSKPGEKVSLQEYVNRISGGQDKIYFLNAPSRELAESSPYLEALSAADVEVLFCLDAHVDEFVVQNLREFNGKRFVSVESSEAQLGLGAVNQQQQVQQHLGALGSGASDAMSSGEAPASVRSAARLANDMTLRRQAELAALGRQDLPEAQQELLCKWLLDELPDRLREVQPTARLVESPALVVDHESAAVRRVTAMLDHGADLRLPRQKLELNTSHPVVQGILRHMGTQPLLAKAAAHQLVDHALLAAGLIDDARVLLPRQNRLLAVALGADPDDVGFEDLPEMDMGHLDDLE